MPAGKPKNDLAGQPERVYDAALRYLARRDYAEQELVQRLRRRGADADAVAETLARLKQSGYLSEERFAAGRVRQRRDFSGRGRSAIRAELRELGVDEAVIDGALDEEFDAAAEQRLLEELASRAATELAALPDAETRRKRVQALQRRLLARGFPPALVFETVRQTVASLNEDDTI